MTNSDNNAANKTIMKNTMFLYIRMGISLVVSLYTSRVILNALGVEDYGIYNVVGGFVSMFSFLNSALTSSIQRFYNYEKGNQGPSGVTEVYKVAVVSQMILAIFAFILIQLIGRWYISYKMVIPAERLSAALFVFQTTLVSFILLILQVPYSAATVANEKMSFFAFVGIWDTFLRLGNAILVGYTSFDKLLVFGVLNMLIGISDFVMYFVYSKKNFKELKFNKSINFSMLKSVFSFSGWNMVGAIGIMVRGQGVNMILNLFFGPVVNAARGVAYSVQSAILGFVRNITTSSAPQMTQSYAKGDKQRSFTLFVFTSKACYMVLYLIALPIAIEIDYILHLWLGDVVPNHTSLFTILVLITSLVDVLNTPVSILVLASGKIKWLNLLASIIGVFSLPLVYFVLRLGFSAESAFIIGIMTSIIVQAVSLIIMRRETGFDLNYYFNKVIQPLILFSIIAIPIPMITLSIFEEGFLRLIFTLCLSSISVLVSGYFVAINKDERIIVKHYLKEFINKQKNKYKK